MRKFIKYLLLLCAAAWFTFFVFQKLNPQLRKSTGSPLPGDEFNPAMERLQSLDDFISYADSAAADSGFYAFNDKGDYPLLISRLIKYRFYHGFSYYSYSDNIIAYLAGKLLWDDFAAIVVPDDILRFNNAACSQQSIIFMEILKRKGFSVRSVYLRGHFAAEIRYNGKWHFFDTNLEPKFSRLTERPGIEELVLNKAILYEAYKSTRGNAMIDSIFSQHRLSGVNNFPARKMYLFQRSAFYFSTYGWVLLIIIAFYYSLKIRNRQ